MEQVWHGWLQFGVGDADVIWYSVVDFLLLTLGFYAVITFLNSAKGLKYLGIFLVVAVALAVSAFLRLPGLHVVAQAAALVLLVSFPIIFHERWAQILSGAPATSPGHLKRSVVVAAAVAVAAGAVFLGSGGLVKIAELPSEIPVKAVNLPTGMTANFGSGKTVRIIVSAPRDIWGSLVPENFSATVDAANRGEGTYDVDITVTGQIDSVRIVSAKPQKAVITVEPVIKKTVPVSLKVSGKAGDNLVPGQAKLDPEKVEIAGPKTVIADISQVYAQVTLNGETKAVELDEVELTALDAANEPITNVAIEPETVAVVLPLVKAGSSKTVAIQPTITGKPAIGYWVESVTVEPAVASVVGTADVLSQLKHVPTEAVSVDGASATVTRTVQLDLPTGVNHAGQSVSAKVVVTLKKVDTTKAITPELVYDGLSSSLKVSSTSPTAIPSIVSGSADLLKSLSGGEVKLRLNLASYKSPGTYSVQIQNSFFELPTGVSLVSFLPSAIDVTLEDR